MSSKPLVDRLLQHTLRASVFATKVSAGAFPAAVPSASGAVMPRMPVLIVPGAPVIRMGRQAATLSIIANHGIDSFVEVLHRQGSVREGLHYADKQDSLTPHLGLGEERLHIYSQLANTTPAGCVARYGTEFSNLQQSVWLRVGHSCYSYLQQRLRNTHMRNSMQTQTCHDPG